MAGLGKEEARRHGGVVGPGTWVKGDRCSNGRGRNSGRVEWRKVQAWKGRESQPVSLGPGGQALPEGAGAVSLGFGLGRVGWGTGTTKASMRDGGGRGAAGWRLKARNNRRE